MNENQFKKKQNTIETQTHTIHDPAHYVDSCNISRLWLAAPIQSFY